MSLLPALAVSLGVLGFATVLAIPFIWPEIRLLLRM